MILRRPQTGNFRRPIKNLNQEPLSGTIFRSHIQGDSAHLKARPGGKIDFELFKAIYPKRAGTQRWERAIHAANARIKEGAKFSAMIEGAERYAAFCEATSKTGTEFVMQAATFLGPDEQFLESWETASARTPANFRNAEEAQWIIDSWKERRNNPANPPDEPDEPERAMPMAAAVKETTKPTGPPVATPESQSARQKEAARKMEETIDDLDAKDDKFSKSMAKLGRAMQDRDGSKVA